MNWNKWFVYIDIGICLVFFGVIYLIIPTKDFTTVNIISIAGSLATLGGLAFTIRQQYQLKRTSRVIEYAIKRSLEFHFNHCLKYTGEIKELVTQNAFQAVDLRLCDLKDCLHECRKILGRAPEKNKKDLNPLPDQVDKFITTISAYSNRLRISKFSPGKNFNVKKFIIDVTLVHDFVDQNREIQSNFVNY